MADNIVYTDDYIVESGISDNWHYTKWNSGKAELWGKITFTENELAVNYTLGGTEYTAAIVCTLPFAVFEGSTGKYCVATAGNFCSAYFGGYSATNNVLIRLGRAGGLPTTNTTVVLHVCGSWK